MTAHVVLAGRTVGGLYTGIDRALIGHLGFLYELPKVLLGIGHCRAWMVLAFVDWAFGVALSVRVDGRCLGVF